MEIPQPYAITHYNLTIDVAGCLNQNVEKYKEVVVAPAAVLS